MKPLVRLVVDARNWAFDNIADHIKSNLADTYTFETLYARDYEDYNRLIVDAFESGPDLVHFFWREVLTTFLASTPRMRVVQTQVDLGAAFGASAITTSVYDHLHSSESELADRAMTYAIIDGYSVASNKLADHYRSSILPAPAHVIPDGVDTTFFRPVGQRQFDKPTFVVGWVGNSDWGAEYRNDPKGLRTILKPAIERLQDEGIPIEGHFADRTERMRTRDEMVTYYSEIDVLVCASEIEGTPNPVLESLGCGVPVISTDVGIVRDALGSEGQAFIVERSPQAIAGALRNLHHDRELLRRLSKENLEQSVKWRWSGHMESWRLFFANAIDTRSVLGPVRTTYIASRLAEEAPRPGSLVLPNGSSIHPDQLLTRARAFDHRLRNKLRREVRQLKQRVH